RRYNVVGHVDHVADSEIDGHTAQDVRLLAAESTLLKQVQHIEYGVAAGRGEILGVVGAVVVDGHAHRSHEAPWHSPSGVREIVGSSASRPAHVAPGCLAAMHREAH